jgi:hypothetical protein
MRAVIHRDAVPPGTPHCEWRNISGDWLYLDMPGLVPLNLRPDGRVQIPCADLAKSPGLEAWLEGCELRGVLAASCR